MTKFVNMKKTINGIVCEIIIDDKHPNKIITKYHGETLKFFGLQPIEHIIKVLNDKTSEINAIESRNLNAKSKLLEAGFKEV